MSQTEETVRMDWLREQRTGIPEAVYAANKTERQLNDICTQAVAKHERVLFTRMTQEQCDTLNIPQSYKLDYCAISKTAFLIKKETIVEKNNTEKIPKEHPWKAHVAIVAGGSSDYTVVKEIERVLTFLGYTSTCFVDVGVAGLWRLLECREEINLHTVVLAVAGMEAALPTVLAGLVDKPIIGVPTSIGYGVAQGGHVALTSMLSSCAQGITVVNIDNGFGAACAAARVLQLSVPLIERIAK
jgi:NCAIR mutase (PurE)-related protein